MMADGCNINVILRSFSGKVQSLLHAKRIKILTSHYVKNVCRLARKNNYASLVAEEPL